MGADVPPVPVATEPDPAASGPDASADGAEPASADAPSDSVADAGVPDGVEAPPAEPQAELRAAPDGSLAITRWHRVSLGTFPAQVPKGGGLYVVERAGRPLFVGEAASFAARFARQLLEQYQLGLIPRGRLPAPFPVTVWLGQQTPNTAPARARARFELLRQLSARGLARTLRNPPVAPGAPTTPSLRIANLLPPPWRGRA
jgi:hypothetical protein